MKNKYKLIKASITGIIMSISITGCIKSMDCNIENAHVHLYVNESNNLNKYYRSEKEYVKDFKWTDKIVYTDQKINIITENELFLVEDNKEYLNKIIESHQSKREAYQYEYVYGYHHGYGYLVGEGKYGVGWVIGWHNEWVWNEIPMDTYTEDQVRDYTYKFKFYKINNDGTLSSKKYKSLDEIEEGYNYFKTSDLVQTTISDSYFLEKPKVKTK